MELVSSENVCKAQLKKRSNILSLFPVDWTHKINDLCSNKKTSQNHNQDFTNIQKQSFLKKVFLKISRNLQENAYARVSFLIKL